VRLEDRIAYSLDEVCLLLGTKRSATYECIRSGKIKSFRVGRKLRVSRAALDEFMNGEGAPALDADAPSDLSTVSPLRREDRDAG
jgi:excisionase family DNA binding protein